MSPKATKDNCKIQASHCLFVTGLLVSSFDTQTLPAFPQLLAAALLRTSKSPDFEVLCIVSPAQFTFY
jgi:hypothetical protein